MLSRWINCAAMVLGEIGHEFLTRASATVASVITLNCWLEALAGHVYIMILQLLLTAIF